MKKMSILIVDDEPMITKSLEAFISFQFDAEVFSSNDPIEAIKIFDEIKPQIVISDFMMPHLNGLEMLKKMREGSVDFISILLTGYADKENAIRCINEVGLYYYCEKPWDNSMLAKIIENGWEKYHLQTQLKMKINELEDSNRKIKRLYRLLKKDFDEEVDNVQSILIMLANITEAKDAYTEDHTRRVSQLCRKIGASLGLDPSVLNTLEMAGIIHDIGKVGVREEILKKTGKLTPEEFEEMKMHTIIGYNICLPLNMLKKCLDPIRHHHEKLDGSGYPDGLKGDEISIEARIVSIADMFDALHSERPYRKKLDILEVKQILFEDVKRGKIDGKIVQIVFELYEQLVAEGLY